MITFNVGPSKVYPEVSSYLQDAYDQNVLSISHRSKAFDAISKKAIELLYEKLNIPSDYTILYTGSATESWEIIAQDLVEKHATHFYNGEFGRKWFEYSKHINPLTKGFDYHENDAIAIDAYEIEPTTEIFSFTLNETSTGTKVPESVITKTKEKYPNSLIAIDTTSCLAGINIKFSMYDVIFASVQKCFGLPAGLGLLILSPKALEKAFKIGNKGRYNSILNMVDKIKSYQTTYTPNVLNIYLLSRTLETRPNINETEIIIKKRAEVWYNFIPSLNTLKLHITNKEVRSDTIITVSGTDDVILKTKKNALEHNIELGSGYGPLKSTTFRIANFPALSDSDIGSLKSFLEKNNSGSD